MNTAFKHFKYFTRRPLCRGIGLLRFLATGAIFAAAVLWAIPMLDAAANVMQLSSVHAVVASQLHVAQLQAQKAHVKLHYCKSDDGLTCTQSGGWEQGWIAFADQNGNGVRDASERIVHTGAALPPAFVLAGDLNAGRVTLCLHEPLRPACRPDQLVLALLSDGSRPRRS